jgi:exodeoxyribonuclease VII large subunit
MPENLPQALKVSELAKYLSTVISNNVPQLWVRGEISNLRIQQNKNVFFTLKDEESKISCVIMNYSEAQSAVKNLSDGLEILLFGNVSYYKKEGSISFFVESVLLLGEGILKQKFEQLRQKLEAEGMFDKARKRKIPEYPEWVGIITSPTGAAIHDILNVTNRRFGSVNMILFPAAVQGDGASKEIARSIKVANKYAGHILDVLIVGRGGGSIEDLWCFNEEPVARAIFHSKVPVISAVGHEIDYTIADYVADMRAPTPSAAAELVVKDRNQLTDFVRNLTFRAEQLVNTRIDQFRMVLDNKGGPALKRIFMTSLSDISLHLTNLRHRFDTVYQSKIRQWTHQIGLYREKIEALNPTKILERGYSITYRLDESGARENIRASKDAKTGDNLLTILSSGEIKSRVEE